MCTPDFRVRSDFNNKRLSLSTGIRNTLCQHTESLHTHLATKALRNLEGFISSVVGLMVLRVARVVHKARASVAI